MTGFSYPPFPAFIGLSKLESMLINDDLAGRDSVGKLHEAEFKREV